MRNFVRQIWILILGHHGWFPYEPIWYKAKNFNLYIAHTINMFLIKPYKIYKDHRDWILITIIHSITWIMILRYYGSRTWLIGHLFLCWLFLVVMMDLCRAIYTSFPTSWWPNACISEMVGKGWGEISVYGIEILWVKTTGQY